MDFKNWKAAILDLDRYENGDDAKEFIDLINSIPPNEIRKKHIKFLLDTFSNDNDYEDYEIGRASCRERV